MDLWKDDFCTPHEVTTDDSAALIKAAVLTFTDCKTTNEYIQRCERILNGFPDQLSCYIRLDVAHFIKNVTQNAVFKKMVPAQKMFYQCMIGVMIQCDSFEKMKEIIEDILFVATMRFESADFTKIILKCQQLIRTHDFSSAINSIESSDVQNKIDDIEDVSDNVSEWFTQIEVEVQEKQHQAEGTTSNVRDNLYFSKKFVAYFKELCKRIPLWTAVMTDYFHSETKIASSSDVESENNILKHIIFKNVKLPVGLDTFLITFFRSIKGSIYSAVSHQMVNIVLYIKRLLKLKLLLNKLLSSFGLLSSMKMTSA